MKVRAAGDHDDDTRSRRGTTHRAVETGYARIYPATALALVRLANAFSYQLVYYGDVDLIFVRAEEPGLKNLRGIGWESMSNKDLLMSLCLRYRASEKAFRRDTRYAVSGYCEEDAFVGLGEEEIVREYRNLDLVTDAELRDPGFRI